MPDIPDRPTDNIEKHIQHLAVYHFFKLIFAGNRTVPLGYEIGTSPDNAYLKLTGRILAEDRQTELHSIFCSTTE